MKGVPYLVTVAILALAFSLASAYDPSPLQDFCVATENANSGGTYMVSLLLAVVVLSLHSFEIILIKFYTLMKSCLMVISSTLDFFLFVNGKFCNDPALVTANDFFFSGLNITGNTGNRNNSSVPYLVTVAILALAFSLASAYDPSPLQDFCVATENANSGGTYMVSLLLAVVVLSLHSFEIILIKFYTLMKSCLMVISSTLDFFLFVNGKFCNDPALVTANDFFFSGLNITGNTGNRNNSSQTIFWRNICNRHIPICYASHPSPKQEYAEYSTRISHMKKVVSYLVIVALLALASSLASAYDPVLCKTFVLQLTTPILLDPTLVTANDFFFSGLNIPGNTAANKVGSSVNLVNVDKLPGLNTLGISLARLDFAPYGLNPPHTHPRGTELLVVIEGTLLVGFVTSNPNKLFTKVLNKGDVFVFPIGLIHFQFNVGQTNAVAFAGLSSQNPGLITIANAVFGSNPPINLDVLAKAFQLDKNVVEYLQKQF
ncbi:germin-like protein subfamily 1 member 7 [Quercus suber]|uniref:Germin-like protein subfamily 1 member 7 n=1 Tax=Quercus suber TaxID=58331 RepID=A0AAW0JU48_QUESU